MSDTEYTEAIIRPFLGSPDELKVERTVDEMGVLISVSVGKEDMGKIIGKEGTTAKSIRHLLRVFGAKHESRVSLKINEPDAS